MALALHALGEPPSKDLEVAFHAGTLLALGPVRPSRFLVAATIPPALAGFVLEDAIEEHLGGPRTVAAGLVAGGIAMTLADRRSSTGSLRTRDGWLFGAAQAAALWPGVSRLGATLTAARARGLGREEAREVAVRSGVPVLAGATVLKAARLAARLRRPEDAAPGGPSPAALASGALGSALSTAAARRTLRRRPAPPLLPFALYRAALACTVLAVERRA